MHLSISRHYWCIGVLVDTIGVYICVTAPAGSDTESADEAILDETVPDRMSAAAVTIKSEVPTEVSSSNGNLLIPASHAVCRSPDGTVRPTPIKIEVCTCLTYFLMKCNDSIYDLLLTY